MDQNGVYNIVDPQLNDDVVTFTAYDNMYKTQQGFFSALSGNQPVAAVLREQCSKIGITYAGSDSGESISIDKLQGLQMRDAISYIASFCGKNAVMNRDGNLELRWFSAVEFTASPDICSSTFSVGQADTIVRRITCAVDAETNLNAGNDTRQYNHFIKSMYDTSTAECDIQQSERIFLPFMFCEYHYGTS